MLQVHIWWFVILARLKYINSWFVFTFKYVCANNIIIIKVYRVNFLACQWRHIFGEILAWSFDTLVNNAWLGWNDRSDCIPPGRSVKKIKNSSRKLYYFRHICSSFGEWAITSFFNEIELLKNWLYTIMY